MAIPTLIVLLRTHLNAHSVCLGSNHVVVTDGKWRRRDEGACQARTAVPASRHRSSRETDLLERGAFSDKSAY